MLRVGLDLISLLVHFPPLPRLPNPMRVGAVIVHTFQKRKQVKAAVLSSAPQNRQGQNGNPRLWDSKALASVAFLGGGRALWRLVEPEAILKESSAERMFLQFNPGILTGF